MKDKSNEIIKILLSRQAKTYHLSQEKYLKIFQFIEIYADLNRNHNLMKLYLVYDMSHNLKNIPCTNYFVILECYFDIDKSKSMFTSFFFLNRFYTHNDSTIFDKVIIGDISILLIHINFFLFS